jgi:parvulin-like peptidyl-prolyl isomerase
MMKKQLTIGAWLLIVAILPAAAQLASSHGSSPSSTPVALAKQHAPATPVARVNGTVLTQDDLLREEFTIFPYARQHGGKVPKEMESQIRQGALQMIIFEELVYQEALRRKMTVSPAKMAKAEADFRKQFPTTQEYQHFMALECQGSEQVLRTKIRRSILIDTLAKSEVDTKAAVTPAQLRAFYDKNPQKFEYPESFAIQTISFIPPQKATAQQVQEAKKRAETALPQAKAAKNYEEFGVLAEKISEDDYRVMMGDHKVTPREKLAPQALDALLKLQAGQVTDIIQVDQVYTIIRLNKHIPAGKTKFEDVQKQLKDELQKQKTNEVRTAWGKQLRANAKIEVL